MRCLISSQCKDLRAGLIWKTLGPWCGTRSVKRLENIQIGFVKLTVHNARLKRTKYIPRVFNRGGGGRNFPPGGNSGMSRGEFHSGEKFKVGTWQWIWQFITDRWLLNYIFSRTLTWLRLRVCNHISAFCGRHCVKRYVYSHSDSVLMLNYKMTQGKPKTILEFLRKINGIRSRFEGGNWPYPF